MKTIVERILQAKIITIVRGVSRDKLIPLAEAMYDGGIRVMECTYDTSGVVSDQETAANIEMLVQHFGTEMIVGTGTVLTEAQVELTKNAGGQFIVSPDTNPDIIKKTKQIGLVSIPGALTPTEIAAAVRAGADFVKVFPVGLMGAGYIKDVSAPLSNARLLAVGGVTDSNMRDYLNAGACGIGIGSGVVDKKRIEAGDFAGITTLAERYTSVLKG